MLEFFNVSQYMIYNYNFAKGLFSGRSTAALTMSLSCSTISQLSNVWSIVCSPFLQEHIGLSLILNLYKYALIFPCFLSIVVKFEVTFILNFNLSAFFEKNDFVIATFVLLSHSTILFVTLLSLNFPLTLFLGILL